MGRVGVAFVVLALALVAGCGGGGGESFGKPPREYAAAICTAVNSWLGKIQVRTKELQEDAPKLGNDLEKGKSLIVTYLDDIVGYSDDLVERVKEADKPDVDHGEAIAGEIRTTIDRARIAFVDAWEEAKNLPTDNPAAFEREAKDIGGTLTKQGKAIETTLDGVSERYDANELDQAFENEASCTSVSDQTT